jgi:hypothetical protein
MRSPTSGSRPCSPPPTSAATSFEFRYRPTALTDLEDIFRGVLRYRLIGDAVEITNIFHGGRNYAALYPMDRPAGTVIHNLALVLLGRPATTPEKCYPGSGLSLPETGITGGRHGFGIMAGVLRG